MNLSAIKKVLDSKLLPKEAKEKAIIAILATDREVIPRILSILNEERKGNRELISNMNLELSRAHVFIDQEGKKVGNLTKNVVSDMIAKFYIENKERVTHCFNRFNPSVTPLTSKKYK